MPESGELYLHQGMAPFLDKADIKLVELVRWGRVSFSLDVRSIANQDSITDVLSLKHSPKYSRCPSEFSDYNLGELNFSKNSDGAFVKRDDGLYCPLNEIKDVGFWLRSIVQAFEKEPEKNLELWRAQANGVPVAVDGVDYFARILDIDGKPFANPALKTYRTGDLESQLFLEKLSS